MTRSPKLFCLHISIPNAPKKLRGKVYEQGYVCTFRSVRMYGSVGCFFLDRKRELNMSPFDTRTFNSLGEKECKSLAAIIIYMYTFIACVTLPPLPLPHTSLFSTCISLNSYQPLLLLTYPSPRILLSTPPPLPPPSPFPTFHHFTSTHYSPPLKSHRLCHILQHQISSYSQILGTNSWNSSKKLILMAE